MRMAALRGHAFALHDVEVVYAGGFDIDDDLLWPGSGEAERASIANCSGPPTACITT